MTYNNQVNMSDTPIEQNSLDPRLAWQLNEMAMADQDMRSRELQGEDSWDYGMEARHAQNLAQIIEKHGWPSIAKVGETASHNAWLLAQHADRHTALQKRCLALMKAEPEGAIDRTRIAFLEDRIMVAETGEQKYGTQFRDDAQGYGPRPIADVDGVDARRVLAGLEPLEEYAEALSKKYRVRLRKNWDPRRNPSRASGPKL